MKLPKKYEWLHLEEAPRHLLKAIELYGITEFIGDKHNPIIMGWAKELGITYYTNDEIPWCGLFVAIIIKRADRIPVKDPLRALSWAEYGKLVSVPMLGDIMTFTRKGGGHVGIYVGEDQEAYHILGGNQSNSVNVTRIPKTRFYQARRPEYNNIPPNVRKITLSPSGVLSINEA